MDGTERFSTKAEKYARYRWDYAPEAIRHILTTASASARSVVADIGSGTGILTRHFLNRARQVHAVEPNPEMRRLAERALSEHPSFRSVDGSAEATGLSGSSVDLIIVGQAIHWFEPRAARREFLRILKPGGWLAILWNRGTDEELGTALKVVCSEENGCDTAAGEGSAKPEPPSFYFGSDDFLKQGFPHSLSETWEEFFGGLCSASPTPDETHPRFPQFERDARRVFERFSAGDRIVVGVCTELRMGQPSQPPEGTD
jgi:SAM-dependent methyltransferase